MNDFAAKIRAELLTQSNEATAHPIFFVEQTVRVWGIDSAYTDTFIWLDEEGGMEDQAGLEAAFARGDAVTGAYRVGYRDTWERVTACLTRNGADEYIRVNGHNLSRPVRVFVGSGYRNEEWIGLRAHFMKDAPDAPAPKV